MNGVNPPLSVGQMVTELWIRRRLLVSTTLVAGVIAATVTLFVQPSYRATVILAPPEKSSETGGIAALAGQFSGLADLAGVNLGGSGDIDQSIALMTSRHFIEQFMLDEHVLQTMYPKRWDAVANQWKRREDPKGYETVFSWIADKVGTQGPPNKDIENSDRPSLWLAVKKFDRLMTVTKDKKTSLVILTVDWRDPVIAARWANQLVSLLNEHARSRAAEEAHRSVEYLNGELSKTHVLEMQETIYKLIEREMRTMMSANVRDEYAFRVLDPAVPPEERRSPKRTLITLAAMFIAGFCTSLWIIFGPQRRPSERAP